MKKLLPILLLFLSLKLSAQDSTLVPFDFENSEWYLSKTGCESQFGGDLTCYTVNYKLTYGGDSIYNGYTYKIIDFWPSTINGDSVYYDDDWRMPCAMLREDSGRVYVKHLYYWAMNGSAPYTDRELLLYDFNLAVGDTLSFQDTLVYGWQQPGYFIVTHVDSMLTNVGYRKTILLAPTNDNGFLNEMNGAQPTGGLTWVEGIGSNKGLLYDIDYQLISSPGLQWYYFHFLCYSLNGQYVYGAGTCDYPLSVNNQKQSPIDIYPNPTNGTISIKLPVNIDKGNIQLYNATGKIVASYPIQRQIDISHLPNGLYYLRLQNESGVYSQKVIINN